MSIEKSSLREAARKAKLRIKSGFWAEADADRERKIEKAREQAKEFNHSFRREMAFLTAHSMLHLLGYDHVDDEEGERIMIEKQNKVLNKLGITRESH